MSRKALAMGKKWLELTLMQNKTAKTEHRTHPVAYKVCFDLECAESMQLSVAPWRTLCWSVSSSFSFSKNLNFKEISNHNMRLRSRCPLLPCRFGTDSPALSSSHNSYYPPPTKALPVLCWRTSLEAHFWRKHLQRYAVEWDQSCWILCRISVIGVVGLRRKRRTWNANLEVKVFHDYVIQGLIRFITQNPTKSPREWNARISFVVKATLQIRFLDKKLELHHRHL